MISEAKQRALADRMRALDIREAELLERFVRSGGRGGQNVNKVSTCVHLKHLPTQTEVKCQRSRYQATNRYYARQLLCDKIEAARLGRASQAAKLQHKMRKQKKRRSRRAKAKMVEEKRARGATKALRRTPTAED